MKLVHLLLVVVLFTPLELSASEVIISKLEHIVKPGDTIDNISTTYRVSAELIRKINPKRDWTYLQAGEKIAVPKVIIIPKVIDDGLIINIPEFTIYRFAKGKLVNTYPIAVGKRRWETPLGRFVINNKTINPHWRVPPKMARVYNISKKLIPPGKGNPLGKYWIGTSLPHIGIHSTNNISSIGKTTSHGCIRMYPKDAEELFLSIDIGTKGEIIYEPVKIASKDGFVFMEVHKDIYGKFASLKKHSYSILKRKKIISFVDRRLVEKTIEATSGIPENITKNKILHAENLEIDHSQTMLWKDFIKKPH